MTVVRYRPARLLLLTIAACGAGCAAPARLPPWAQLREVPVAPDNLGTFYGVGLAQAAAFDIRTEAAADQLARTAVYDQFRAYLHFLIEYYRIQRAAGPPPPGGWARLLRSYKEFAAARGWRTYQDKHLAWLAETLEAACPGLIEITERHFNHRDGRHYSLATLELTRLVDLIDGLDKAKPEVRAYIRANALAVRREMLKDALRARGYSVD